MKAICICYIPIQVPNISGSIRVSISKITNIKPSIADRSNLEKDKWMIVARTGTAEREVSLAII